MLTRAATTTGWVESGPHRTAARGRRLVAVVVTVGLLLSGCSAKTAKAQIGKLAPPITGPAIVDGQRVDLASFRGRPTLVNFWGSWCDPCRRELPRLVETERAGTAILGVAVNDSRRRAREMLTEFGAPWPSADDPDSKIARSWGVGGGFPVTFALDAAGVIRGRYIGEMSAEDLAKLVASAQG